MLCVVKHFHVVRRHSHRVARRVAVLLYNMCKHHLVPVVVVIMMLYNVLVVVPPDPVTQLADHRSAKLPHREHDRVEITPLFSAMLRHDAHPGREQRREKCDIPLDGSRNRNVSADVRTKLKSDNSRISRSSSRQLHSSGATKMGFVEY